MWNSQIKGEPCRSVEPELHALRNAHELFCPRNSSCTEHTSRFYKDEISKERQDCLRQGNEEDGGNGKLEEAEGEENWFFVAHTKEAQGTQGVLARIL